MDEKIREYQALLANYKWMLTQSALNRGGNPTVMRLTKLRLEALKKEIEEKKND